MKEYSQYVILNFHIMKLLIFAFQILDLSIGYNLISTYIFSLNPSSSTQESTDYIYINTYNISVVSGIPEGIAAILFKIV